MIIDPVQAMAAASSTLPIAPIPTVTPEVQDASETGTRTLW